MFIKLVLEVMEGMRVEQERMGNLAAMNYIQNLAEQAEILGQMEEAEAEGRVVDLLLLQVTEWAAAAAVAADMGRLAAAAAEQIIIILTMPVLAVLVLLA